MKTDLDMTLYLVTDSTYHTEETFYKTIEEACQGGVTLVQLREKNCGGREYLEKAMKAKAITDRYQIPLIIDDRVDVAIACDAAGVHVGSSDLPVAVARKLLGPDKIVGATAKTVEAAKKAYEDGADYLGVGAIFPTTTKVVTIRTSVETLNEICQSVPIPAVAIGGLNDGNMDILKGGKMAGVAVVSAIMKAEDPKAAAARMKEHVGELPDSYNLIVNTDHPLSQKVIADTESACKSELTPILDELKTVNEEIERLQEAKKDKKDDEIPVADKEALKHAEEKAKELRAKESDILKIGRAHV